jgi:hypothetical protein
MSGEKTLSKQRLEEVMHRARELYYHQPTRENLDAAIRDGSLDDMIGAFIALADLFLTPSFTLADLLPRGFEVLESDAQLHDMMLDYLCARYDEGEIALTPFLLPMLVRRFREYFAHISEMGLEQGKKAGAHRVARTMAVHIHIGRLTVEQAAAVIAPVAGVTVESAKSEYYRYWKNFEEK